MVVFKQKYNAAKEANTELPRVPEYAGECILRISQKLATKPNFINYPFKEDMIGDGYENCLQYIHNFDPNKTKNPFAYFTTVIFYAFLRRIDKEKKQLYVKQKVLQNFAIEGLLSDGNEFESINTTYSQNSDLENEYMNELVEKIEEKIKKKKIDNKKKGIGKFYE